MNTLLLTLLASTLGTPQAKPSQPTIELFETTPLETTLDREDLRQTHEAWLEMLTGAKHTVDLEHFYFSEAPEGVEHTGLLDAVLSELVLAAQRGVKVRIVADAGFHDTYPEPLDRLDATLNIDVRLFDMRRCTGGVVHAKLMIVDGEDVYLGSPNFDWRSLEHVQELGVRVRSRELANDFGDVFELDWRLAAGEAAPTVDEMKSKGTFAPIRLEYEGEATVLTPVASPQSLLPDPKAWDLPRIVELLDGATKSVRLQMLSYGTKEHEGLFADIDSALRRAEARGVRVQLLFADWSASSSKLPALKSLQVLARVEVRLTTIPEWSKGFVEFARVAHSKFITVDGARSWIGTSNGSQDYFTASRNVGLVVDGTRFAADLEASFDLLWTSPYARTIDPCADYTPPRRSR